MEMKTDDNKVEVTMVTFSISMVTEQFRTGKIIITVKCSQYQVNKKTMTIQNSTLTKI